MKILPENPTQFDYLHAIRALAARGGLELRQIYLLADEGMQIKWNGKCPEEQEAIDTLNKDSILGENKIRPAILDPEHYPEDREAEGDCSPSACPQPFGKYVVEQTK